MASTPAQSSGREATLREVVETLAPIERAPCSEGEAQAAGWLAQRLQAAGAVVEIEAASATTGYARTIGGLCATGIAGGVLALSGLRRVGAAVALAAGALIVDDVSNGKRPFRKATTTEQPTTNVIGQIGPDDASRTVVVLAHHDAAPTGQIFDQTGQHSLGDKFPGLLERVDTALPVWWPVVAGPVVTATAALTRRRGLLWFGTLGTGVALAAFADIERSPIVPGANDNLSACAVLVAVAEALGEEPVEDMRVLLVSCGAEEVLQGGIHAFMDEWGPKMDREATWFVNLDTIGSPRLVMLEGEGPFVMEDYYRREYRDLVYRTAERNNIGLRRGMRSRASTDAVIPSRAGYPITTLTSIDRNKALSNYHLMSDTPDNLDYGTIGAAAELTEQVIRALGRGEPG